VPCCTPARDRRGQHRVREPAVGVHSIDPAKLNAVLSAVADVCAQGDRIGHAITDANNVLLDVNPRMPTVRQDWQCSQDGRGCIRMRAQTSCRLWTRFSTTTATLTTQASRSTELLLSAVGFSQSGINHDRRKPAEPGARDEHPRSDDRFVP